MKYFDSLPKVVYTDQTGTSKIYTNILCRADFIPSLLSNPLVFYTYDIQDEDTPEIVSYKYYGDVYRYWMVLYCNQIMDPQWDWPLSTKQFETYIFNKYKNAAATYYDISPETINMSQVFAYTAGTAYQFEKIITQVDLTSAITTTNTVVIDEDTYNGLSESMNTYTLPTGAVKVTITKDAISIYTYELRNNEDKRNIKILNKSYAGQLEKELKKLMSK